jgi:hypothetical protein
MYGISVFVLRNERFPFLGLNYDSAQHSAISREIKEGESGSDQKDGSVIFQPSAAEFFAGSSFSPLEQTPILTVSKHSRKRGGPLGFPYKM